MCLLCGRDKFTTRGPHRCIGGFRKRKIQWAIIDGIAIWKFKNKNKSNENTYRKTTEGTKDI